MWNDWTLSQSIEPQESSSALTRLPPAQSKAIVTSLVTSLLSDSSVKMDTDQQVIWCLEVLQYGLLSEPCHTLTQDCVTIYCQWLSVLLPNPHPAIPCPVVEDAQLMARKMMSHLCLLFKRVDCAQIGEDEIVMQGIKVLRLLEEVGKYSTVLERETWHCLLSTLLAISDQILGKPGSGGHLCYTVVSVLIHTWLTACAKSFPEPTMWKTLITLTKGWSLHRVELVSHWSKVISM